MARQRQGSSSKSRLRHTVAAGPLSSGGVRSRPDAAPGRGPLDGRTDTLLHRLEGIFVREGFRRVTVGELAARLRCSRRALYEVAASKEEVFLLVLDRILRRIDLQGREAATGSGNVEQRLFGFIEPGISALREAGAAFFADIASLPAARERLAAHQDERRTQLEALLAEGVETGTLRTIHPAVAARVMVAAYRAVTDAGFLAGVDLTLPETVRATEEILLHGIVLPHARRR